MIIPHFYLFIWVFLLSSRGKFLLEMEEEEYKTRRAFMRRWWVASQYDKVYIRSSRFSADQAEGGLFEIEPLRGGHHVWFLEKITDDREYTESIIYTDCVYLSRLCGV